jgi:hypothetical protein
VRTGLHQTLCLRAETGCREVMNGSFIPPATCSKDSDSMATVPCQLLCQSMIFTLTQVRLQFHIIWHEANTSSNPALIAPELRESKNKHSDIINKDSFVFLLTTGSSLWMRYLSVLKASSVQWPLSSSHKDLR